MALVVGERVNVTGGKHRGKAARLDEVTFWVFGDFGAVSFGWTGALLGSRCFQMYFSLLIILVSWKSESKNYKNRDQQWSCKFGEEWLILGLFATQVARSRIFLFSEFWHLENASPFSQPDPLIPLQNGSSWKFLRRRLGLCNPWPQRWWRCCWMVKRRVKKNRLVQPSWYFRIFHI